MKIFIYIAATAMLSLSFPAGAVAKNALQPDMTVSPAITEWLLKPGEKQIKTVKLINLKEAPIPLRVVAEAMTLNEKAAPEYQSTFDASDWFTITEPYFILKAKEVREVTLSLAVPKNAEPGGHYATIYFQQFIPASSSRGTLVAGQVGALAFITVQGKLHRQLALDSPIYFEHKDDGSINVGVSLKNEGNVHLLPRGRFIIKDWIGKTIASLPLPTGIVLPHTKRTYTTTWKQPPLVGYATISAEIEYGEKPERLIPMPQAMWILPGEWTVAIIILLPLILWSIWRGRRRLLKALRVLFQRKLN